MMTYRFPLIILLAFVLTSKAQVYMPIQFPEKVDKKYIINPILDEAKFRKKVAKKIPRAHLKTYTYNCAFSKAEMFKSGKIYLSWPALETYINQVLDSIIPGNLKNKKIKAFIGRSSEINAYCLYDGTMIVNAGLLAEVKNEAALATVMGHELAHYIKSHSLNSYVKTVKSKKKGNTDLDAVIKNRDQSQKNELEADDVGYGIAKDAGYDVGQASTVWELFIREKEYDKKRRQSDLVSNDSVLVETKSGNVNANTLEKLLSTHPDEKERQDKLQEFLSKNKLTRKSLYKMDDDLFDILQNQARLESIALVFAEHNYAECLERAFRFHLYSPNEPAYYYYIAESIRRLCLMDYTLRKKGFLSDKLLVDVFSNNKGILHDLHYLVPNEDNYKQIKATELLSKDKFVFETYKEAFYYFNQKLIKKDYVEAYLSAALFENNQKKREEYVTKYLAKPNALRKEYAKNYLNNTLAQSVTQNPGEIVMIPRIDYYRHSRYTKYGGFGSTWYNFSKSEVVGTELADNISTAMSNNLLNTKAISLPAASTQNFNTKEKYEQIIFTSFLAQRDENEGYTVSHYYKELEDEDYIGNVDIFRLNPEVWDFFRENNISAITYARYIRHDSKIDHILRKPAFYLGFITSGFAWLVIPFQPPQYKQLSIVTYDARAEVPLAFEKIRKYRINSKKAIKMFSNLRKEKEVFIKENYSDTK